MPWLKADCIQGLQEILAFIDYPSDPVQTVEFLWETKSFDETVHRSNCPFPKYFDINWIDFEKRQRIQENCGFKTFTEAWRKKKFGFNFGSIVEFEETVK